MLSLGLGSPCGLGPRSPVCAVPHTRQRERECVPCWLPTSLRVACVWPPCVCGQPSSLRLYPGHCQFLVWRESGLHGLPEASGAFGICRSLCSWGFLPFFRSASLFGSPCPVFALATFFNKLSLTKKVFVIIMASRKQFPCLSENTA